MRVGIVTDLNDVAGEQPAGCGGRGPLTLTVGPI